MTSRDPIDILREATRLETSAPRAAVDPNTVLQRLSTRRPPRRRRRLFVAGAIVAVSGAATVTWALTNRGHPTDPVTISCHQAAELPSSQFIVTADGSDPVEQCRADWPRRVPEWGPVPELVGCAGETGVALVFPGDDQTCASLGLAPLDFVPNERDQAIIDFEEYVTGSLDGRCVEPDEVRSIVADALKKFDLGDWSLRTEGIFDASQPCGSVQFDPTAKVVAVQPLPDLFSGQSGG